MGPDFKGGSRRENEAEKKAGARGIGQHARKIIHEGASPFRDRGGKRLQIGKGNTTEKPEIPA